MRPSVFDHRDYKAYLGEWLRLRGRGGKRDIAAAIRCHTAYVTHVFGGSADLSLEQASVLSRFLGHTAEEEHFFLLLVQLGRAGNDTLRAYVRRELRKVADARLDLKNRLEFRRHLSGEDQSVYYSAWYYSAIFALASIPRFRTPEAIARKLRLPAATVGAALEFLLECGLLIAARGGYKVGTTSIHLGSDARLIRQHHTNWRMQAIRSADQPGASDLHYSSVVSVGREDVPKLRAAMVRAIEEIRATVKASPEQEIYAYCLDLFEVCPD